MPDQLSGASVQKHLEIKEIKDDVIVLKNKGLRTVLMTTSINIALKSTEEQDAIIYKYQDFLNSLDFSIQIIATSRKFDIAPYIQNLSQKQNIQENELLRIQTAEYIDFIRGLTEMTNIMAESFYLVVPYSPSVAKKTGLINRLFGRKGQSEIKEQAFQELKNNLWQRVDFIATGLAGIGIRSVPLNTEELIELFYKLYNPSAKEKPELARADQMRNQ